jgi:protein O-GlcNAc transferase
MMSANNPHSGDMTIQQALELALQHHQSGRLHEAERIYRQILAREPNHADALHLSGLIAHKAGQNQRAVELITRAIQVNPSEAVFQNNLGIALVALDRKNQAIAAYRTALHLKSDYAEAHYNLGAVQQAMGRLDEAIAAYRQAIALRPNYAEAHSNLGNSLIGNGQLDEAIAAYRQAIAIRPNLPEAHSNLGNALHDKRQLDEAIAALRQAIAIRPNYAEAYYNLGNALKDKGQLDEAITQYRLAIGLKPNLAIAYNNLGNALKDKGQLDEAIAAYRKAIRIKSDYAEAHNNLGNALKVRGQSDQAIAACRQSIALKPNLPEAHNNLGNALKDKGQLDQAIAAYRQAIALKPNLPEAHNSLGIALKDKGQFDQAIAAYRAAIALRPNYAEAHSNLIFSLHYDLNSSAKTIGKYLKTWNKRHAEPLSKFIQPHLNDRGTDRKLRIGYVSEDFCQHVVGWNLLTLLQERDRKYMEIFCYSGVVNPDAMTAWIQSLVDGWRSIVGVDDQNAAEMIRNDKIDILVDLTLHSAGNRLLIFARKPAPVQVTFMGYPGSTGLDVVDYRLTDPYLDPPGLDDEYYSEESVRLPHTFWCYHPLTSEPGVNALPALQNGYVTFGCLNNFCKVNDGVLELWAKVLAVVPQSHLMLLAPQGQAREHVLARLNQEGIGSARIEFQVRQPRIEYLKLFNQIDVGLDTFPYNGHTTSLDSFWMGVPVATLVGQTVVGRAGWSQLCNLNLRELAAQTPEEYVKITVQLANDQPRLSELRRTLRLRMQASPLMDAPRFARNVEAVYRAMWRKWCQMPANTELRNHAEQ